MKKNMFLMATAFAVTVPAIVAPIPTDAATYSKTFKDVPKSHDYYEVIHSMANNGFISGYPDGTFKPSLTISRQHAAVLISNAVNLPKTVQLKEYKDVPKSYMYYEQIKELQMAGLLEADSKGNFNPNQPLTRGEMAKILTVAYDLKVTKDHPFTDVSKLNVYNSYISALYSNGLTVGYEDGTFKPNQTLNRAHYVLFMDKAMKLENNNTETPTVPTVPPTTPPVDENISPSMSLEDFNSSIESNPNFDLFEEPEVAEWVWESEDIRKTLTDGQKLITGTDFKFRRVSPYVTISYPTWENIYQKGFLEQPIIIGSYDNVTDITFDHTNVQVTEKALEFLNLLYPNLNLESSLRNIISTGRQEIASGNTKYMDMKKVEIDGYKIQYGITVNSFFAVTIEE